MKKLKYFIYLMLFLLITFSVTLLFSSGKLNAGIGNSQIIFDELKFDFGNVEQGNELTHSFKFKNTGSGKLIIVSVQPSCGCTGATVGDKKEYEPGEEGEIKITFNTQGRTGVHSKSITVVTNDPVNQNIILTFTCNIANN